jgi:hypothetical protein
MEGLRDNGGCTNKETIRRMYGWRRDGGMVKVADSGILGIEPRSSTWDMAGMALGLRSSSWRGRPKAQHGAQADVSE